MSYPWYTVVDASKPLGQGDIIFNCPILTAEPCSQYPYFKHGFSETKASIIMTQACDLAQNKVDAVLLCELIPLKEVLHDILEGLHNEAEANKAKDNPQHQLVPFDYTTIKEKKKKTQLDMLIKGEYVDWHPLNKTNETSSILMDYQAVYLRESTTLPLDVVKNIVEYSSPSRLRLMPPYREHLGQAFTRNYMRIGLPNDIKIDLGRV